MELTLGLQPEAIAGFLLVLVRSGAWVSVCPPFGTRMVPVQVKVGLSFALALAVAPRLGGQGVPLELAPLITAAFVQAAIGITLGFLGVLLFSAFQAAGAMIDLFGGFSAAQLLDPMSGNQTSVFGRFYQLLFAVLLFAIDGHLLLVRGFLTSFDALGTTLSLSAMGHLLTGGIATMFVAAIEIAAPLLAALFLADIGLGLLARAAPEMNIFLVGLPLKILLTIGLVGIALPLLPGAVSTLTQSVVDGGARLLVH